MLYRFCFLLLLVSSVLFDSGCKPKKLENGKEIADEFERRSVKRITDKQILSEATRIGDSLVFIADTLLHTRLTQAFENGGITQALTVYPPEKYAEITSMAQELQTKLTRQTDHQSKLTTAQTQRLSQTEVLYTAPIYLKNTCLKCHGQVNTDIATADFATLQAQFPGYKLNGFKTGEPIGRWHLPLKRQVVLASLTMKRGKDQRIRNLFK